MCLSGYTPFTTKSHVISIFQSTRNLTKNELIIKRTKFKMFETEVILNNL